MSQDPLTLYYSPRACSLAAHILLEESGLAYEAVRIDIRKNQHRSPEYLAINPRGTVPILRIGEHLLSETHAILTYIADLVPGAGFLPVPGTLARARAHEWMNFISSTVHIAFRNVFRPGAFCGEGCDQRSVKAHAVEKLRVVLNLIDERLGNPVYSIGPAFSAYHAYLFVFYMWSHDERLDGAVRAGARHAALARLLWQRPAVRRVAHASGLDLSYLDH